MSLVYLSTAMERYVRFVTSVFLFLLTIYKVNGQSHNKGVGRGLTFSTSRYINCTGHGITGADPGGGAGVLGVRTPTFGRPPNFIKREKNVAHVHSKTPRFST